MGHQKADRRGNRRSSGSRQVLRDSDRGQQSKATNDGDLSLRGLDVLSRLVYRDYCRKLERAKGDEREHSFMIDGEYQWTASKPLSRKPEKLFADLTPEQQLSKMASDMVFMIIEGLTDIEGVKRFMSQQIPEDEREFFRRELNRFYQDRIHLKNERNHGNHSRKN